MRNVDKCELFLLRGGVVEDAVEVGAIIVFMQCC